MKLTQPIHVLKRRARLLSREQGIPLHAALDRVAQQEGFRTWSHLSAQSSAPRPARDLFAQLEPGDLILLAARPRQGKTALGLELAVEAVKAGHAAAYFTLESTEKEIFACLGATESDRRFVRERLRIDTSDEISADHIIRELAGSGRGTLVVVDYLQLLDQRRRNPELIDQVVSLRRFTGERGLITVCLSQINRSFELSTRAVPTFSDVRLPNPLNLELFTKACFLHAGRMRFDRLS